MLFLIHGSEGDSALCVNTWTLTSTPTTLGVDSGTWTICPLCIFPEAVVIFTQEECLVAFVYFPSVGWAQCVVMFPICAGNSSCFPN